MSHDETARCLCVADHRPPPLEYEWHHVWPLSMGGDDTPVGQEGGNGVWLCPTTHTNVHELLRLLMRYGPLTYGEVSALQERPVSRFALRLASDGYWKWRASHDAQMGLPL